jgi:hypothetical protein
MDFSSAGYMGGGVALPNVPVKRTVKPSNKGDDAAAIQAAIDAVAALPLEGKFRGTVVLGPGTFVCSNSIVISASGVVLRGSGTGPRGKVSTIRMAGRRHAAITSRSSGSRRERSAGEEGGSAHTSIADSYVPSGTTSFSVADAKGFAVGDVILIRRPVTETWVKFMGMDDMTRNGRQQTWIRTGTTIDIERRIAGISGNRITVEVPLSDSLDAKYLDPPGTAVVKINPPSRLTQVGIESLHIECPPQAVNHSEALYSAVRLTGEDCWMRDVVIDETMNSVGVGGRRITLERVAVNRKALHQGSSKPAEFAPNGDQILLDHCSVSADNVWFVGTGAEHSGPIVLLNCAFRGNGHIEGHQRWTTGMLLDNCVLPDGGIDFKNRGSMGSGHGWGTGWAVAWNCVAKSFVIQQPPGAYNWAIGCKGERLLLARPFGKEATLPSGEFDSHGVPVVPRSLYLAQLAERLGPKAVRRIGLLGELFGPPDDRSGRESQLLLHFGKHLPDLIVAGSRKDRQQGFGEFLESVGHRFPGGALESCLQHFQLADEFVSTRGIGNQSSGNGSDDVAPGRDVQ